MAYDMDRKLVFVNPAVETLTGYSMEELEKANFICWVHPDDQARMLAFWDPLFQGKSFHEEEYRLVTKDGRVKWVVASWMSILDDSGRQVGVQGREFDITQRKLAETALRHSREKLPGDEERYRALFENSPFPMWEEDFSGVKGYLDSLAAAGVPDIRGHLGRHPAAVRECVRLVRVLDVNRAARDFYGVSRKEELLENPRPHLRRAGLRGLPRRDCAPGRAPSPFQTEFSARTLKGEERLVDMIVSIVDSARHDWSRVIVSFFDITDRKRLEEQFAQSQKMESLGRLAGGIAHDFNNLLTVINGYTDWILREMEPANPFTACNSTKSATPASGAPPSRGNCSPSAGSRLCGRDRSISIASFCDLRSVLDRVLGDDIRICTHLAPDLGTIKADAGQMHQVLMNLAVNAREAMPGGGTLTIETRNLRRPPGGAARSPRHGPGHR